MAMPGKKRIVTTMGRSTSRPVLLMWIIVSWIVSILCTWSYCSSAWTIRTSQVSNDLSHVQRRPMLPATITIQQHPHTAASLNPAVVPVAPARQRDHAARISIPHVQIGLFGICIYSRQLTQPTCVDHSQLTYEWLPFAWQVTRMFCGASCIMLLTCASLTLAMFSRNTSYALIETTAIFQLIAAVLLLLGLCSYPFGLQSESIQQLCNDHCMPGWASLVMALCSAAAILCPVLAILISRPIYDVTPWQTYLVL